MEVRQAHLRVDRVSPRVRDMISFGRLPLGIRECDPRLGNCCATVDVCVHLRGGGCGDPLARIAAWVIYSHGAAPAGGKSAEELAAAVSSKALGILEDLCLT